MKGKLKYIIIITLVLLLGVFGVTYAFYEFYNVGDNHELIVGNLYLKLNDGTDTINLTNVFPETKEEARDRKDNQITFTVTGLNTTNDNNIYYDIMLNEGDSIDGKTRAKGKDLVFDLIEVNADGTETFIVDAQSFDDIKFRLVLSDIISHDVTTEVTKTYKLRVWLSENVLISDTNPDADYTTSVFANSYASVKVVVYGDFIGNSNQANYLAKINSSTTDFWPTEILSQKNNITEVKFVSMRKGILSERYNNATIKSDVTDTSLSEAGSVLVWLETSESDSTKYVMYIASDGNTIFPSDCRYMFWSFQNLLTIGFGNIDVSKVTNMASLFSYCSKLKHLDVSGWDVGNVINMSNMFMHCSSLTSLNVSSWDVSSVNSMSQIFNGCSSLISLDVSSWDVSSVTIITSMFYGCRSLTSLDLSEWDTSQVTNMLQVFSGCSSLTSLHLSEWDTSNVTNMYYMFRGCSSLTSLDVSGWDIGGVTNFSSMFVNCSGLITIYVNTDWNTGNVTSSSYMFSGCTKLVGAIPFDSTKTDITMANPTTGYFTKKTTA